MPDPHPLDPLSPTEVRAVVAILRRDCALGPRWRFASIDLREPEKGAAGGGREADVVGWDRNDGAAVTAVVSLGEDRVLAWERHPGRQAAMTADEFHECEELLRGNPEVIAALRAHGVTDMSLVLFDIWAYGGLLVPERLAGRRVGWVDVWYRETPAGNPYAHPLPGIRIVVDVNAMEIAELTVVPDFPRAAVMGEYVPRLVPGLEPRADVRPLEVTQPEGPSFTLEGRELRWQNWSMRLGFTTREGLVIHAVSYRDGDRERPVAARMSFAEMVVPYRDPSDTHRSRTAFDIGEWGLGFMTTSLKLGCDCLGEIRYLDATIHDSRGEPVTIENAICIHEEDDGILWKHVDHDGSAESRRSRRLVVSFHATVANYEYLTYWRFHQDGAIECEVRATGIMITTPVADGSGKAPPHGVLVDRDTYAPVHQHFIVARLDLDVDGEPNTVLACEMAAPGISESDPDGLALVPSATALRTEAEGRQDYDWHRQRSWKVVSARPDARGALGQAPGYQLVPGAAIPALLPAGSPVLRRARVLEHTLWVTPYAREERWPCGRFPNLSTDDDGLSVWTGADRSIEAVDVVLWYVFGIIHVPRPEEWPVMPVDTVSFWLKPSGFFDRNPALDVPGPHHC